MESKQAETQLWDPAEHLETSEDIAAYLDAALEEGDPALIAAVLGDIARTRGMTQLAREAGLGRESLYKALSAPSACNSASSPHSRENSPAVTPPRLTTRRCPGR